MKISARKIKHLVRESVKRKLKEKEDKVDAKSKEGERESSTIGKKASKSGLNTLETHLGKLKTHGSYELLKQEAAKGPEQKLQLLDMLLGDLLGIGDEVLKPISQQIINAFRKGVK